MRHRTLLPLFGIITAAASLTFADHKHGHPISCPACDYVCEFSTEKTSEKKSCYEIECKPICIPPITFPWEKGHAKGKPGECTPGPRCGKVRIVRQLVKEQYECSRCKCVWKAVPISGKREVKFLEETEYEFPTVELAPEFAEPPTIDPTAERDHPWSRLLRFAQERGDVRNLFSGPNR